MNTLVRRLAAGLALDERAIVPVSAPNVHLQPPRQHRGERIFVSSQLALGMEPHLRLTWSVVPSCWTRGYVLMGFRSVSGFSPEPYPHDLNRHGQLVLEAREDGGLDERPGEGSVYYTFLLYRRGLFGLWETMSLLRFSETIPSAKVGIGRIRDQIELRELMQRNELGKLEHDAKLLETQMRLLAAQRRLQEHRQPPALEPRSTSPIIRSELENIDLLMEACLASNRKRQELLRSPEFQGLSEKQRQRVLRELRRRLNVREVAAAADARTR